jgi:catalase
MSDNAKRPPLSHASGARVTDNLNIQTAGPRGPALLQDV